MQTAQVDFNNATAALTQAQHDAQAAAQGQQYGFQVLDPPQLPTVATPQTKKIIIYPIAALIVGLGLSAMLLVLLVASDRSVRSEADLAPGLRVLGRCPDAQAKACTEATARGRHAASHRRSGGYGASVADVESNK